MTGVKRIPYWKKKRKKGKMDGTKATIKPALAAVAAAVCAACAAQGKPKAVVFMLDGCRADAIENAAAPNMRKLMDGKWQEGYSCAWSLSAQTVPDAISSSAPNHVAIATGVTTAKNCVTNLGVQMSQCDYKKYPSWLVRVAEADPSVRALFMYGWPADERICPHPRVEAVPGSAVAGKGLIARAGVPCAKDVANGAEFARRLSTEKAPDAAMIYLDLPDHAGHGYFGGEGAGFYPYRTSYLKSIAICDAIIGKCMDAIAARPSFKDEDWMIVITADHGGYSNTHGLLGGHATSVPLLVSSRGVKQGRVPGTPKNYDAAPTVLRHFGIDVSGFDLDGKAVGGEVAQERTRPLAEGLAAYFTFDGKKPSNGAAAGPSAVLRGRTKSGAAGGILEKCLIVANGAKGAPGGVLLKGSEALKFENGADFAMTMWVRMDAPQKADALIFGNKDWSSGNNPGIALCASKCTEYVKNRGVVFNCVTPWGRKRIDIGTYDVEYGKWVFYAIVRGSDGVARLYQGAPDGTLYFISEDVRDIKLETSLPFHIGQDGTGRYGATFNGAVDDFALWTRELSHGDVRRIYEAGRKGLPLGDLLKGSPLP